MIDDAELLRRYVEQADEPAFAELVTRHVNLVHSTTLRQVNGDAHLASPVRATLATRPVAAFPWHPCRVTRSDRGFVQ